MSSLASTRSAVSDTAAGPDAPTFGASAFDAPAFDATALVARLARDPASVLRCGDAAWDGPALAALAASWRAALREAGVAAGDRVLLAPTGQAALVGALLGARTLGATVALARPDEDLDGLARTLDARLLVAAGPTSVGRLVPDEAGAPPVRRVARALATTRPPTRDVALLLRTSGSGGAARWIALSRANVDAVLASHAHALPRPGAVVASVLPWHHCFGLVMELVPALARGAVLVREPDAGRDGDRLARVLAGATHLSAVPATLTRLLAARDGAACLAALQGGLVGGAPVEAPLADALVETRLRVGYGQTEAAPGIALGEPGEWRPRWLGRAIGCEVRIDADGELAFRGANACLGEWGDDGLRTIAADAWRRTGDIVRRDGDGMRFEGRASAAFKLANGRWVEAWRVEAALRARVPALRELQLDTRDGGGLVLLYTADAPPPEAEVRVALGALGGHALELRAVAPGAWPRTPKGEVDRRAARATLLA